MLKALKFRIERALDVPNVTPEPGGFNSRQSQSERHAEPAAQPAPPYVSFTPSAPVAQVRAARWRLSLVAGPLTRPVCTSGRTSAAAPYIGA